MFARQRKNGMQKRTLVFDFLRSGVYSLRDLLHESEKSNLEIPAMKKKVLAFLMLIPACAWANSMPINFIPPQLVGWFFRIMGFGGILLAAALGGAGLMLAARKHLDSSGKVFARGFLGVSAVACFGLSAACIAFSYSSVPWVGKTVATLTILFLAVEFGIAGALYARVHAGSGSSLSKALSLISYFLCALLGIAATIVFGSLFSGIPVAEALILCGACALAGFAVYGMVKNGLPVTPAAAFRIWLMGLGAFVLAIIGAYMVSTGTSKDMQDIFLSVACFFLGMVTVFEGWLLRRLDRMAPRVIGIGCYVLGGALCVMVLLEMAG